MNFEWFLASMVWHRISRSQHVRNPRYRITFSAHSAHSAHSARNCRVSSGWCCSHTAGSSSFGRPLAPCCALSGDEKLWTWNIYKFQQKAHRPHSNSNWLVFGGCCSHWTFPRILWDLITIPLGFFPLPLWTWLILRWDWWLQLALWIQRSKHVNWSRCPFWHLAS